MSCYFSSLVEHLPSKLAILGSTSVLKGKKKKIKHFTVRAKCSQDPVLFPEFF